MEALTAVTTALLTIYDMCKAIDKHMHIEHVHLVEKVVEKAEIFLMSKCMKDTFEEILIIFVFRLHKDAILLLYILYAKKKFLKKRRCFNL